MTSCVKEDPIQNNKENREEIPPKINTYIHISHTREALNPDMDTVVEVTSFTNFDMTWLGGDLAYLTSEDVETMDNVNSVFDLSSPNTLFSLGKS